MSDPIRVTSRKQGLLTVIETDTFRHLSNNDLRYLAGTRGADPKWAGELDRRERAGVDHVPSVEDIFAVDLAVERYRAGRHV